MPVEPHRMRIRTSAVLVLAIALTFASATLGGCSEDDPTPEELRRDRIESRLDATFPKAQVTCILDGLDDPTMIALDRDADLSEDSEALRTYSFLVRACAADPTASATTTTGRSGTTGPRSTSSTAPATTSTDARSDMTTTSSGR